jgi:hypothetical protein
MDAANRELGSRLVRSGGYLISLQVSACELAAVAWHRPPQAKPWHCRADTYCRRHCLQAKALLLPWHLIKVWLAGSMNILVALFHLMVSLVTYDAWSQYRTCLEVDVQGLSFCFPSQGLLPNDFANRVKVCVSCVSGHHVWGVSGPSA